MIGRWCESTCLCVTTQTCNLFKKSRLLFRHSVNNDNKQPKVTLCRLSKSDILKWILFSQFVIWYFTSTSKVIIDIYGRDAEKMVAWIDRVTKWQRWKWWWKNATVTAQRKSDVTSWLMQFIYIISTLYIPCMFASVRSYFFVTVFYFTLP